MLNFKLMLITSDTMFDSGSSYYPCISLLLASVYAVAAVGAVLILIGFIVLIIASVVFFMHYKRGSFIQLQIHCV